MRRLDFYGEEKKKERKKKERQGTPKMTDC